MIKSKYIQDRIYEYKIGFGMPRNIEENYNQPHRFYHTWDHVKDLLNQIYEQNCEKSDVLILAAIYHDIVYDPKSTTNEEDSAQFFKDNFGQNYPFCEEVIQVILDTKTHQGTTLLSKLFCKMDLDILKRSLPELIDYEHKIFKEFQFYDYALYKKGRIDVLLKLQDKVFNIDLSNLIQYIEFREPKIGLYPGSFNPFHKGHLNIFQKAERIFDKVIVAYGNNPDKKYQSEKENVPTVLSYKDVKFYDGLLTDFIKTLSYPVTVVRGLRNSTDLQYELNQYRFLQDLTTNKIDVIALFCDRELEHISSSAIRQLKEYGKDTKYL